MGVLWWGAGTVGPIQVGVTGSRPVSVGRTVPGEHLDVAPIIWVDSWACGASARLRSAGVIQW